MICSFGPFTLWHHDPCNRRGCRDDSCGWFMRASHGDPEMLKKIRRRMDYEFDRVFKSYGDNLQDHERSPNAVPKRVYYTGLFYPTGGPNFSVHGIALNLFFTAIHTYFSFDWKKSRRWMRHNLFDILMFAENPTDSMRDGIMGTFRIPCGEKWDREAELDSYASMIYGWILRAERPWYRHPRWHVHHWRLNCRPFWRRREKPQCVNGVPSQ